MFARTLDCCICCNITVDRWGFKRAEGSRALPERGCKGSCDCGGDACVDDVDG